MDDHEKLGPHEESYPAATVRSIAYAVLGAALFLGGVGIVLTAAGVVPQLRPAAGQRWYAAGMGAFLFLFGAAVLVATWWFWGQQVDVYEDGLVCRGQVIRWNEITRVHGTWLVFSSVIGKFPQYELSLECGNGPGLRLGNATKNLQDLARVIQGEVLPRLRRRALKAFDAGELVELGPIWLDKTLLGFKTLRSAIKVVSVEVPWAEVVDISVEGAAIHVATADKPKTWQAVPTSIGRFDSHLDVARVVVAKARAEGLFGRRG